MRFSVIAIIVAAAALAACASHHASSTANTTPLNACEIRQTRFGNVATTLTANADGSLARVDVTGGTQDEKNDATQDVYRAFGQPQIDTNVHPIQSKWGLNTWMDRCGRTVPPRVAAPRH